MIEILIIFTVCIIGVGVSSYNIGIREGATAMVDQLIAGGTEDPITKQITIVLDPE